MKPVFDAVEITEAGCHFFGARIGSDGYGRFGRKRAHRVAYERTYGPIPDGLQIDHLCHNRDTSCPGSRSCLHRRCVNPEHLEAVTQTENIRRGQLPQIMREWATRHAASITHCPQGHPYSGHNLIVRPHPDGHSRRQCRTCHNAGRQRRKRALRALRSTT